MKRFRQWIVSRDPAPGWWLLPGMCLSLIFWVWAVSWVVGP